jgi:hypothetical protein
MQQQQQEQQQQQQEQEQQQEAADPMQTDQHPDPQQADDAAAAAAAAAAPDQQQQQQQVWYQLDARGKIDNFDEVDWFVPETIPFKRRQNVSSTMAASRPHPWKRVRHHIAAENYGELPADVPTYVSLEAPPPLYPPKRYCDITGSVGVVVVDGDEGWQQGVCCMYA